MKYARDGYSEKEAYALVSMSLGHGDGRGRYVKAVYCRYMPPYSEIQERAKAAAFQRLLEQGVQWSFASCEVKWSPLTDNSPMTKGLYESYSFIDLGF